jgi:rhodanese-related sulfurtransferase
MIKEEGIDNTRVAAGVALVNVLKHKQFTEARIPGSVNIPLGREDEFDHRFHKDKMIVLYSQSDTCEIAQSVARALTARGFRRVYNYAGGLANWRATGGLVMSGRV